jgi:hypothetical protein
MRGKCNVKIITYKKNSAFENGMWEDSVIWPTHVLHERGNVVRFLAGTRDSLQSVRTIFGADPASQRSGREYDHSSYIAKIKLPLRSISNYRSTSRYESLKILCCIIYIHQRPKAYTRYIEVTTTKIKSAINKSIITRIFCFDTFNIVNFSVVVRKYNTLFSLFSVSGKWNQSLQRELDLNEVRFISTCRQV